MAPLLQVKDLRTYFFTYNGLVKAVDGITYDLSEGETVGIVGESGSGKSVSALSLMRLIPDPPGKIVGGEVVFQDQNLLTLRPEALRRVRGHMISMIFQEPMSSLNPVLTIGRQLTETLELHLKMSRKQARKRAAELLQLVSISDARSRLNSYPHQFSGGMRQRVMIAMALSCNPKLIIADEPTTALDVTIQAQVLDIIKELTERFGTAVIIITHNLGVVARHAQRVNVMYAGKIVESGDARSIYGDPRHPYTLGLLASVPRLDEPKKAKLIPIEGVPPDLMNLPKGCSFRARCRYAIAKCAQEEPPLIEMGKGHLSACWVDVKRAREKVPS